MGFFFYTHVPIYIFSILHSRWSVLSFFEDNSFSLLFDEFFKDRSLVTGTNGGRKSEHERKNKLDRSLSKFVWHFTTKFLTKNFTAYLHIFLSLFSILYFSHLIRICILLTYICIYVTSYMCSGCTLFVSSRKLASSPCMFEFLLWLALCVLVLLRRYLTPSYKNDRILHSLVPFHLFCICVSY